MNIEDIQDPQFLKNYTLDELNQLAFDIRIFLIKSLSQTGGHLSSNLGVVDLTIALHYVFDSPKDRLLFDVGHQSYTHKLLTGRASQFNQLRKLNGLSGYQKRNESIHDPWEAGHSSTSLSAALGLAIGRDLNDQNHHIVPIIGDGALTGGMALEALNQIGGLKSKVVIILNDNEMSISKNVGGLNELMSELRLSMNYNKMKQEYKEFMKKTRPTNLIYKATRFTKDLVKQTVVHGSVFTEFGIEYIGPVDGHDFKDLIRALNKAKNFDGPIVVHVVTKKGRGYRYCEIDSSGQWHGVDPFNVKTGESLVLKNSYEKSWSEVISHHLHYLMENDRDIVTITPAMIKGSKLENVFQDFPERSFDVGIAEEHAATFAAGLSLTGKKPFLSIYSTFLQRAYDQINHDIARMNLPVVIGIDRAGLVGDDGETHQGVFDISFLIAIPNLILAMPKDQNEAQLMLNSAFNYQGGPFCIRYPRGNEAFDDTHTNNSLEIGSWDIINKPQNPKAIIIAYGPNVNRINQMVNDQELPYIVCNARFIKPIDYSLLNDLTQLDLPIFVYETDMKSVSLYTVILSNFPHFGKIFGYGIGDHYVEQGTISELIKQEGLSLEDLFKDMEHKICQQND